MFRSVLRLLSHSLGSQSSDPHIETLDAVGPDVAWALKQCNYHRESDIQAASAEELAAIPCLSTSTAIDIFLEAGGDVESLDVTVEFDDEPEPEPEEIVIEAGGVEIQEAR